MNERTDPSSLNIPKDIRLKKAMEIAWAFWRPKMKDQTAATKRPIIDEIIKVLGPMSFVKDIDRMAIVELVHHYQERGVEVAIKLRHARQFFKLMVEEGVIVINPVQFRRLPFTIRPPKVKPLISPEQYRAILIEAIKPRHMSDYLPTFFMIGWETGLRSIDAAMLRWGYQATGSYVDLEKELIVARPRKKESKRERLEIPISGEFLDHMRGLYAARDPDCSYVMPYLGMEYAYGASWSKTSVKEVFKACGMPEHSYHCFRHTFVSRLVRAGVNPIVIADMTGQTIEMIQHYSRVDNDDKRTALDLIRNANHSERLKALGYEPPKSPPST